MKRIILLYCSLIALSAGAQKTIDGLINAEKSFAAYAVAHGTKEAFMSYLDSTAVVFENKKSVNGHEAWKKRQPQPGILNWHPQFAEISSSGDFGYTTGPYTFQPKTINDSITGRGQFNSVWRMDAYGTWKNIVDIGNRMNTDPSVREQKITAKKIKAKPDINSVLEAEASFAQLAAKDPAVAYKRYLSSTSILNHNGFLSSTSVADQEAVIKATAAIQYKPEGSGIASSGDLAYIYGISQLNDKNDNYLRVWRREKEGWKIALEVLHH